MKAKKNYLNKLIREALSVEVPELSGGRKSSWQVRKEKELAAKKQQRSMQADMQAVANNIAQVATELISDPSRAATLVDTFPPAIELREYQETMDGGLRIDSFLDKIEDELKAQGVDRVVAIKFVDSFLNFR